MNYILLAGGSGTRLWSISTQSCPKQFVSLFEDDKSMLKKTYDNLNKTVDKNNIYIVSQRNYMKTIFKQVGNNINYINEPSRIGTFGAILNIAAYLKYIKNISDDDFVSVIPTDHDVSEKFYNVLFKIEKLLRIHDENLGLIGIEPSFPSTEFGYILYNNCYVNQFFEKPNLENAIELINKKALWNSGIIVFRLKYIINISKKYIRYNNYKEFIKQYNLLPKNSFDKEILENEKNIVLVKSREKWNDLGTWKSLINKVSIPDEFNTNIVNFENKKICNCGVRDSIIINSKDGLLLQNKSFDNICYTSWGYYKIIANYYTNKINVQIQELNIIKGKNIIFECDKFFDEHLLILSGIGKIIFDNDVKIIKPGENINISQKKFYNIISETKLCIIKVRNGINEND